MVDGDRQDLPEEVNVDDVESLLGHLAGVEACRVVCNQWGAVEEIHILAVNERHPKQIVRDIESALAAKWGLQVDHKKISVAQVERGKPSHKEAGGKLELVSMNTISRPGQMQVETCVIIRSPGGGEVEGRAVSVLSPAQYGRVSAEAAVRAVAETMEDGYSLHLEDIRVLPMTGGPVVVCQLSIVRPRGDARIVAGISPLQGEDLVHAAVEAVLGAVNSFEDDLA